MIKQKTGINLKAIYTIRLYGCIAFSMFFFSILDAPFAHAINEYTLKAVFTLNFAKFTKWPEGSFQDASSPCIFCIYGDNVVESDFQSVSGNSIGTRKCLVEFAKTPLDFSTCHILFLSRTVKASDVVQILDAVKGKPVLTIGETEDFIQQGGVINFFIKNGRLYFEINLDIVRQQNVWLSSRLLKLAILTE